MNRMPNNKKNSKHRHGDSGPSATRFVVLLFFILLVSVCATMYFSQNTMFARITASEDLLAEEEAAASQENEDAKALKNKVGSDSYIEAMARDELGMVKTGETIFETETN